MLSFTLICFLWIFSVIISAGFFHAFYQRNDRWEQLIQKEFVESDLSASWAMSLGGPISLILAIPLTEFFRFGWLNPFKFNRS